MTDSAEFQKFLDAGQYSNKSILRYEQIFGHTWVSTGGEETTTVRLGLVRGETTTVRLGLVRGETTTVRLTIIRVETTMLSNRLIREETTTLNNNMTKSMAVCLIKWSFCNLKNLRILNRGKKRHEKASRENPLE